MPPAYVWSNVAAVITAATVAAALWTSRRQPLWRATVHDVWRRRPLATIAVCAYLLTGALDSIAWVDGADGSPSSDLVARY